MCKSDVDRYPSRPLVPCQVKVHWVGGGNDHFYHKVKFSGAKEDSYGLAVTLPTSSEGPYAMLKCSTSLDSCACAILSMDFLCWCFCLSSRAMIYVSFFPFSLYVCSWIFYCSPHLSICHFKVFNLWSTW